MTSDPRRTDPAFHYLDHRIPATLLHAAQLGHGDGPAMQLVELVCPHNPRHTLGLVITDDDGHVRIKTPKDPAGPRLHLDGARLVYICHACRRAGSGTARGRVRFEHVLDLAAALAWDHPASAQRPLRRQIKVSPTRRELAAAQVAVLSVNNDAHRAARRAFRDSLTRAPSA